MHGRKKHLTKQIKGHLSLIIYQTDGVTAHASCRWPHTAGKRVQPQANIVGPVADKVALR